MDFGPDKRFWYGTASGGPTRRWHPVRRSAHLRRRHADVHRRQDHRRHASRPTSTLTEQDLLRVGGEYQNYRLDDWWPRRPARGHGGPSTFWNINDGKRDRTALFGEWEATLEPAVADAARRALRAGRRRMPAMCSGYNTGHRRMRHGQPDRATPRSFNALDREQHRQQLGPDRAGALHAGCQPRHRIRLRPQGALAQPVRALHLVHLAAWRR